VTLVDFVYTAWAKWFYCSQRIVWPLRVLDECYYRDTTYLPFQDTCCPSRLLGVRVAQSLFFCVVFCEPLFVCLSFFCWPLTCLCLSYPFGIFKLKLISLILYMTVKSYSACLSIHQPVCPRLCIFIFDYSKIWKIIFFQIICHTNVLPLSMVDISNNIDKQITTFI